MEQSEFALVEFELECGHVRHVRDGEVFDQLLQGEINLPPPPSPQKCSPKSPPDAGFRDERARRDFQYRRDQRFATLQACMQWFLGNHCEYDVDCQTTNIAIPATGNRPIRK